MNARPPLEAPVPQSELGRLAPIARIAAAKGLGRYTERLGCGRAADSAHGSAAKSDAVRLRETFEELGPTFVKLGHMMASRTDLFPEELVSELGKLHEAAASFPAEIARKLRRFAHGGGVDGGFVVAGALGIAWAVIALKSGRV